MPRVSELYPAGEITLREVGLRDGLQLVKTFPSTDAKREWIRKEYGAGVRHFEVGSFLPPARFPQFADIRDLLSDVAALDGAHSSALTLNERGINDALASPVDELVCVVSASEEHSLANARRTREEAVALVARAVELARQSARRPKVYAGVSVAFGCTIAGEVPQAEVMRIAEACLDAGADHIGLADTVGFAGPAQVGRYAQDIRRLVGDAAFGIHLHDTRGMAIANAAAALDAGARILDGSLGGLGGCPFAPGASGNIVFEDLVFLCETKGFATGIDVEKLAAVREILEREMPSEPLYGMVAKSGPPPGIAWRA
ncbi:MAG: hydroxymethylglutaryl-CoA lyase [Pseudomonadota bacterium]